MVVAMRLVEGDHPAFRQLHGAREPVLSKGSGNWMGCGENTARDKVKPSQFF